MQTVTINRNNTARCTDASTTVCIIFIAFSSKFSGRPQAAAAANPLNSNKRTKTKKEKKNSVKLTLVDPPVKTQSPQISS